MVFNCASSLLVRKGLVASTLICSLSRFRQETTAPSCWLSKRIVPVVRGSFLPSFRRLVGPTHGTLCSSPVCRDPCEPTSAPFLFAGALDGLNIATHTPFGNMAGDVAVDGVTLMGMLVVCSNVLVTLVSTHLTISIFFVWRTFLVPGQLGVVATLRKKPPFTCPPRRSNRSFGCGLRWAHPSRL
jgi:hypothetical protein